jgi:tetratricopeptide (TPR) repeat protein
MLQILMISIVAVLAGCTTMSSTLADSSEGATHPPETEKAAVMHRPSDSLMFNILAAEIAAQSGDHNAAFAYYREATQQTDHPSIAERGAKLSIHSQNVLQTIEATQRWVTLEPESIEANRILGALYLRSEQSDKAFEQFQHLLKLKKGSLEGFKLVAEQLRKEPNAAVADPLLERLVKAKPDSAEAWYVQGWYYARKKRFKPALSAVDRALKIKSHWGKAVVLRVSVLESLGRSRELVRFLKKTVSEAPNDVDILVRYGQALLKQRRDYEAVIQFEQALELQPRSAQILSSLSLIHLSNKQYKKSHPYLQRLLELPGQRDKANFYLGEMEEGLGHVKEATAHYASVGKGALYLNARVQMATLMAKEDVDSGLSILRGMSFHDPNKKVQVLLIEAGLLEGAKRYSDAIKIYDQALKISPENEEVLYSRAMAADLSGDLAMLERDLHTIVKKNPGHYHAWNALGYTLSLRTERYAEAKGYLEKALALRPEDFYVLDSMGWVLYKMGEMESALDFLNRALKVKKDAEVAAHLGEVRWESGDKKGAKAAWKLAREIDANNEVVTETLKRYNQ